MRSSFLARLRFCHRMTATHGVRRRRYPETHGATRHECHAGCLGGKCSRLPVTRNAAPAETATSRKGRSPASGSRPASGAGASGTPLAAMRDSSVSMSPARNAKGGSFEHFAILGHDPGVVAKAERTRRSQPDDYPRRTEWRYQAGYEDVGVYHDPHSSRRRRTSAISASILVQGQAIGTGFPRAFAASTRSPATPPLVAMPPVSHRRFPAMSRTATRWACRST